MTLRERQVADADRRLVDGVREQSAREAGVEDPGARRERRRAERSREASRDSSNRQTTREAEDMERRRRREETERRRARDDGTLGVGTDSGAEERRRRRSNEERRTRRHEETTRTAARQIEHQSSLRSLISASDVDSREMEEEILRQIREEGLLDGIDLENLDVSQEDQISERIAEAFRRRQAERARQEPARRSDNSGHSERSRPESARRSDYSGHRRDGRSSAPDSRETSGDDGPRTSSRTRRARTHSRSSSAVSAEGQASTGHQSSRPPPSMSAVQAAHLEVQSSDEGRHRRRRTGSSTRSATDPVPVADPEARPAARSQTDLSNRPHSMTLPSRPIVSPASRSTTDPSMQHAVELPALESSPRTSQSGLNTSPRMISGARMENTPIQTQSTSHSSPRASGARLETSPGQPHPTERRTRAALPADISVPSTASSVTSQPHAERSMMPTPLSPREATHMSLSDKATALSSGTRPISGSSVSRGRQERFQEPSISCARCAKPHIEYELHYNCGICSKGTYNICLDCYRRGKGCLHWFGFGYAAWTKWESVNQSGDLEPPHMLKASRFVQPRVAPGGADGRRTITTDDPEKRLQSGTFCANCLAWTNECYWRCDLCNEGDWGFCNICVNQGKSCTHPLLPLKYEPPESSGPPLSPTHDQQTPPSASILTGPGVMNFGNFKPLTFSTACDICRYPIQPSSTRYHCFSCTSRVPNTLPGDYDICSTCYPKLITSRRISAENGFNGWRRCLQGHRMVIVGFEDSHGGQRRVVVQDLVGGRGIIEEPYTSTEHPETSLMKWSWGDGVHRRGDHSHVKLVTLDVMRTAPTHTSNLVLDTVFPPDGGVGMIGVVTWAWYPAPGADDELMFPRGAIVKECKDVNGDWFHGTYMGKRGLFPAPYVKILDRGH
jgi:SH3 domain